MLEEEDLDRAGKSSPQAPLTQRRIGVEMTMMIPIESAPIWNRTF